MFVKILRENDFFVYVNKTHIVHIEPNRNGKGCNISLTTQTMFYSEESAEAIIARL